MKTIDTFFVLRMAGTDKYMRQLDGRGYTHYPFVDNCIPRLFTSQRAANNALTWFCNGPIYAEYVVDTEWGDGHKEMMPADAQGKHGATGKKDRALYEVVPVELNVVPSLKALMGAKETKDETAD